MFKKIIFIAMSLGLFAIMNSTKLYGQVPWYVLNTDWSACAQTQIAGCSDCTEQIITETIMFEGCPCFVTYKVATCNCPEERTFIEILYIRVNIYTPPPCSTLIETVHPDFPTQSMEGYKWLLSEMYDDIMDRIFMSVADNYPCPEKKKYFDYFSATCEMLCGVGLSAPGQPDAVIWLPKYCTPSGCCTAHWTYCKKPNGGIEKDVVFTGNQVCAGTVQSEPCPSPGNLTAPADHIMIGVIDYTVTWVETTECSAVCYIPVRPLN